MAIQPFTKVSRSVSSGAVKLLAEWLARAEAGEILEVSMVALCVNNEYITVRSSVSSSLNMAALHLKQAIKMVE